MNICAISWNKYNITRQVYVNICVTKQVIGEVSLWIFIGPPLRRNGFILRLVCFGFWWIELH
jgi:hypothetical protein